jgi:hypothetical protein
MSGPSFLHDGAALDKILDLLHSGREWNDAMLKEIADIVDRTTRTVRKPTPQIPSKSTQQKP